MGKTNLARGVGRVWGSYAVRKPFSMPDKFKIVIVGNFGVGKTSTLLRITKDEFSETTSTIVDSIRHSFNDEVDLLFTDTAGEERFKSMTSSFYRNCAAMLLVYDVTDESSFTEVSGFLQEANRFNEKGLKFLVACKTDLEAVEMEIRHVSLPITSRWMAFLKSRI